MQPPHLSLVRSLPLTPEQATLLAQACAHEQIRAGARAKDERLGDETREREVQNLRELRVVTERLRSLCGP